MYGWCVVCAVGNGIVAGLVPWQDVTGAHSFPELVMGTEIEPDESSHVRMLQGAALDWVAMSGVPRDPSMGSPRVENK